MRINGFQVVNVDVGTHAEVFSNVLFDAKGGARAARMNGCQRELYHLRINNWIGIDPMYGHLCWEFKNFQFDGQTCRNPGTATGRVTKRQRLFGFFIGMHFNFRNLQEALNISNRQ